MNQSPILGIDHICLTVQSLAAELGEWSYLGWKPHFTESGLPLQENKKPFMRRHHPTHDMAFLTAASGISVEIIRHHPEPASCKGRYEVEFSNNQASVVGLLVKCHDLNRSLRFWKDGIGFTLDQSDEASPVLTFRSLMPRWSTRLFLEKSDCAAEDGFLDDEGYTCLSLMTRSVADAQAHLVQYGARDFGQPFNARVGQHNLKLNFFRGPEGELFELIEALK